MGRIIARRMPHTITCRSRALDQIFVILPVGENGLSVSYDILRGFATIFSAADSSIAITYNNITSKKDSKDLIQFSTPAFQKIHTPTFYG